MFWFPDTHVVNAKLDLNEDPKEQWITCCCYLLRSNSDIKCLQLTHGYPYLIQSLDVDFELHSGYLVNRIVSRS